MSYTGQMLPIEEIAKKYHIKLISEVRRGIFSEAKFDLLFTNPDEFLDEYLTQLDDETRAEVKGMIKHVIVTGFFRMQRRAGAAERAGEN